MSSFTNEGTRFRQLLLRGVLPLLLLLVAFAGLLVWQVGRLLTVNRGVAQSNEVLARANRVYRLLIDQEAGLRGYLITGEADFLAPFRRVQIATQPALAELARLDVAHVEQQQRVNELTVLEAAWQRYAHQRLRERVSGRTQQVALVRQGKQEMDQMRSILEAYIREEERHREQRSRLVRHTISTSLLLGGGVTLLLGAILALVSSRQLIAASRTYSQSLRQRAEGEARLSGIIGSAMDAILALDGEQRVTLFNASAEKLFGCPAAAALGQPLERFIPERFRDEHRRWMEAFCASRVAARAMDYAPELHGLRADGAEFPMEATLSQITVGDETLFTVIIRDVTERQRAEVTLRQREARFRALIQNSQDIIFVVAADGTATYASPSIQRVLGYDPEALIGTSLYSRVHPDERARLEEIFRNTDPDPNSDNRHEFRILDASGTWRNMETVANNLVNDPQVGGVVFNTRDVTERKLLEQQLQQAQKMEAVGRLAGGVAHDFNNMLAVINGYSEILLMRLTADDAARTMLTEIRNAAERAAGLTRQLLAFSRQQVIEPTLLDLRQVVLNFDGMLRRLIGEDIEVVIVTGADPCFVRADPSQVEQVILNLAVNARDAMPQGGQLTLEVRVMELDQEYARHHLGLKAGRYVMLAISDTGCGMDAETQARIFEPFYTTKERGKGTGLGLATVYGIVKQSGGDIWIYSEPNQGTTFKVYVPEAVEAPQTAVATPQFEHPTNGSETILLAEDEQLVRQLAQTVLTQAGYTVLAAATGEEALKLAGEHDGPIHLLLTDVVMPGISGRELAERLLAGCPEAQVLYMSGYTDDAVVRHGILHEGVAFIQKPFTPAVLLRKLREVLGGRGESTSRLSGGARVQPNTSRVDSG